MNKLGRRNVLRRVVVAAVRWWSGWLVGSKKEEGGENEPRQKSWFVVGHTCLVPPSLPPSVGPYPLEEGRGRQG